MKTELLHILQHSLGVDQYGRGRQYRNHFSTGPGSDDFPKCVELVRMGLMVDHGPQSMTGGDHYFQVTDDGKAAVQNPPLKRWFIRTEDDPKCLCIVEAATADEALAKAVEKLDMAMDEAACLLAVERPW